MNKDLGLQFCSQRKYISTRFFTVIICTVLSFIQFLSGSLFGNAPTHADSSIALWAHPGAEFKTSIHTLCSVGFPASDAEGKHYFITALHCFVEHHRVAKDSEVFDYNPETEHWDISMGHLLDWAHPHDNMIVDAALVLMSDNVRLSGGLTGVPVAISPIPGWGHSVCARGYRDEHVDCGMIQRQRTLRYDSELGWRSLAFTTNVCVLPGDSGGPVWSKENPAAALGLVQASNSGENSCDLFPHTWFTPLTAVMEELHKKFPTLYLV